MGGCLLRKGECDFPRLFGKKGKIQSYRIRYPQKLNLLRKSVCNFPRLFGNKGKIQNYRIRILKN